jgi:hypothetical protein
MITLVPVLSNVIEIAYPLGSSRVVSAFDVADTRGGAREKIEARTYHRTVAPKVPGSVREERLTKCALTMFGREMNRRQGMRITEQVRALIEHDISCEVWNFGLEHHTYG